MYVKKIFEGEKEKDITPQITDYVRSLKTLKETYANKIYMNFITSDDGKAPSKEQEKEVEYYQGAKDLLEMVIGDLIKIINGGKK